MSEVSSEQSLRNSDFLDQELDDDDDDDDSYTSPIQLHVPGSGRNGESRFISNLFSARILIKVKGNWRASKGAY